MKRSVWLLLLCTALTPLTEIFAQTTEEVKTTCHTLALLTSVATGDQRDADILLFMAAAKRIRELRRDSDSCEKAYFDQVVAMNPHLANAYIVVAVNYISNVRRGWNHRDAELLLRVTTLTPPPTPARRKQMESDVEALIKNQQKLLGTQQKPRD